MATNITEISFNQDASITVEVELNDGTLYQYSDVTDIDRQEHGVMLDYTNEDVNYRVFLPYGRITQIFHTL